MRSESDSVPVPGIRSPNGRELSESSTGAGKEITLLILLGSVVQLARRYRKVLYRGMMILLLLGVLLALIVPPTFTARATILPPESGSGNISRLLSALPLAAAQMLSPAGESKMVELYVDIAKSQSILSAVLNADYHGQTFRDALRSSGAAPDWKLIERVRESFAGSKHPRTQLVMFELNDRDPELAAALLNEILRQMDGFFRYRIATNENVQRKLIESRLTEVADSLRITEDQFRQFKERNRATMLSPNLRLEETRLFREVEINNALYIELTKQLELARISEAETMPILNVLDFPVPPQRKSGPSRSLIVIGVLAFGMCVIVLYINFHGVTPVRIRRLGDRLLNWQQDLHA